MHEKTILLKCKTLYKCGRFSKCLMLMLLIKTYKEEGKNLALL